MLCELGLMEQIFENVKIMAEIKVHGFLPDKSGYAFSLFPLISMEKRVFKSTTHFELVIGLWFWVMEICWVEYGL